MTGDATPGTRYRQSLYDVVRNPDLDLATKQRRVLALGVEYLDVDSGHVARVDRGTGEYTVVASEGDPDVVPVGTELDLATTYCRRTVETAAPLALSDAPAQGWADDPATDHGLDCYLGVSLTVDGDTYGTMCFMAADPREDPFTESETLFVELAAQVLGTEMERAEHERELAAREDSLDARARELERTRRKFETLVETAPDALLVLDADTAEVVEVNEAAEDLLGRPEDDILGRTTFDLHPEGEREKYANVFAGASRRVDQRSRLPNGDPMEFERPDGERVPVEISAQAVTIGDQERYVALMRDVSERRERLQRLRESERQFRRIAETSSDVIFQLAPDGELTYVSDAADPILGYDPDDLTGRGFEALLVPADRGTAVEAFSRCMAGEPVDDTVVQVRAADDDTVYLAVSARPMYDPEDESTVVGVQATGRDVTGHRERQRELRVLNRAVEAADVGITVTERDGDDDPVVYANPAVAEMTGHDEDELLGEDLRVLQGPDTAAEPRSELARAIEAGEATQVELRNYRADGTPFWNEVSVAPVRDPDGDVANYVGFHRDVTERKRRERLLTVLNRVLRHNVRNDVNVVRGWARELAEDLDGEHAATARRVVTAADDLLALAGKAHDLQSTVAAGSETRRLALAPVVEKAVERVQAAHPDATVELDVSDDLHVLADDTVVEAFVELVGNAVKHGADPVCVGAERDGARVVVTVSDCGPGLPEQELATLNADRETPLQHGSGLGLWVATWLVTGVGGTVVASNDGGATVRVALCAPDDEPDSGARPRP
jgi:PAS domain S-box-containing protein